MCESNLSIYKFVDAMIAKGYATIPGYLLNDGSMAAQSFGSGQVYSGDCRVTTKWGSVENPWDRADFVGIRLDNTILIDYDGNKPEKPDLTVSELARQVGVRSMRDALVQWGVDGSGGYNGSFHFLFLLPAKLNRDNFHASQDGKFKGIDFKTENQMMWIKRHKRFNFPDKDLLPPATKEMIELLRIPKLEHHSAPVFIRNSGSGHKRGMAWLEQVCNSLACMGENSGRNTEFNQMALAAIRLTMANEIPPGVAESKLKQAAMACKMPKSSINATWNSAHRKALRAGPKNMIENNRP